MRRGKRFLENDNMFIYVGTAIFILLAVGLGVIMYMTTKTGGVQIQGNVAQEKPIQEETENVSTEIGKSVEEQTEEIIETEKTTSESDIISKDTTSEVKEEQVIDEKQIQEIPDEPDTITQIEESTENEITETEEEITFIKPTEGEIICEFAKDNLIYSETLKEWITHTAIDIKADKTSVIKSSADGVVKSIVNDPRYGLTVVIEHNEGYETVYSNLLTAEFVVEGEEVTQGQTIGTAGNTASFESNMECHLHFELLKDGEYLDPAIYLK